MILPYPYTLSVSDGLRSHLVQLMNTISLKYDTYIYIVMALMGE